ncbi:hypothetical protein Poly24_36140 [Rosistilla carotiformis]|uniref:Uncharacterized protein n=1 Tax=Rosistilla carotiformis TaxID=2528017 RepID=A0A518JWI5_9BACT|nr:hypothetical protein [Rosistilla carotiformis]QDV69896.1 hypothetical protein Poly24_36140 [Rosistilla carotiformis]
MTKNPILDELHATRERLLVESGGTISGLLDRLRAEQATSDRPTYKAANHAIQRSGGGDVAANGESAPAAR